MFGGDSLFGAEFAVRVRETAVAGYIVEPRGVVGLFAKSQACLAGAG